MGRYLDWTELVARYPRVERVGTGATDVDSQYIAPAEAEVEGRLGPWYTVPFSDNNITAKDLAADVAYLRMNLVETEDRKALMGQVSSRFKRLINGDEAMVTIDGTIIQPGSEVVWSNNQGYTPVFDLDDTLNFAVDSDRIDDVEDDRGIE